ncbi:MAG: hypothetical protein U9N73_02300, partial [Candidatus Auribacterota bacterium]|nr:hypothetical protein [Candidatus Auribacterota bacterium]
MNNIQDNTEERPVNNLPRFQDILDTQDELISRFLPDGTLTFVNRAYREHSDPGSKRLIGRNFMELLPKQTRA